MPLSRRLFLNAFGLGANRRGLSATFVSARGREANEANSGPGPLGQLLGRFTHQPSEGNHRNAGQQKRQQRLQIPGSGDPAQKKMTDERQRQREVPDTQYPSH